MSSAGAPETREAQPHADEASAAVIPSPFLVIHPQRRDLATGSSVDVSALRPGTLACDPHDVVADCWVRLRSRGVFPGRGHLLWFLHQFRLTS